MTDPMLNPAAEMFEGQDFIDFDVDECSAIECDCGDAEVVAVGGGE
jgi:hypothetical protein